MPKGRIIKISEEMDKNVRRESEGQKVAKIYLKWINFCMDKTLPIAISDDFCVV